MEISRKACRLCLGETEFNISLYSNYCRRTNMIDKILVCLKVVIEETDGLSTICFNCASNVERYYDFTSTVKKTQMKIGDLSRSNTNMSYKLDDSPPVKRHVVTSYVRKQVIDADYTFSFLEVPKDESQALSQPKTKPSSSSPFFSYLSPPNVLLKQDNDRAWKTPRPLEPESKKDKYKRPNVKPAPKPRHLSGDLFSSQSQEEDVNNNHFQQKDWNDWKFSSPDSNIMKRVREQCFGKPDF